MADLLDPNAEPGSTQPPCTAALYDPRTGSLTTASSMLGAPTAPRPRSCSMARSSWRVADCNDDGAVISTWRGELYVPAGVSLPPLPAFPSPPPPVFPSPTPSPDAVPARGRSRSAERSVLECHGRQREFRARDAVRGRVGRGGMSRLVGSATPNVVPAGATVKVTFLFPAKGTG